MPVIANPSLALAMADATPLQDVFDTCAVHLLTQKHRAMQGASCAYRGNRGQKCAVGCLIADNEYQSAMENKTAAKLINYAGYDLRPGATTAARDLHSHKLRLLALLQEVHDSNSPEVWLNQLYRMAHNAVPLPLSTDALTPFGPPPGDVALPMISSAECPYETPAPAGAA